jgi:hypothetical protein
MRSLFDRIFLTKINTSMNEPFKIKLYFEPEHLVRVDEIISPTLKIEFDNNIIDEKFIVKKDSEDTQLPAWTGLSDDNPGMVNTKNEYEKYVTTEFTVDLDDDVDMEHNLKLSPNWNFTHIDSIKELDKETGFNEDFGVFVKDIEINEISVSSLIYDRSVISVPLCLEENYADDGFIQHHLVPEGLTDKLQVIDGRYWYTSTGDYVHMPGSTMNFTFKTPLYLWLLELLLQ